MGTYHCFGCGEGGDVISFLQKMDHTTFSETVEKLAHRINYTLRYEDGGTGPRREDVGKRQRLLDAHKVAAEFFREQLQTPGASAGREFLSGRGFDQAAADHFAVGYAPQGWDGLLKHLTGRGFSQDELRMTGMFSGRDGSAAEQRIYDRFRGRLIWPIRDLTGATIGFGARKLYEDDQGPKYLNTPETVLYKKSQVLYGIDLAKRDIARSRQLVVVEGYTDVMACHLSGIQTAVATCGTSFGTDHIKIARRLLSDDGTGGEVIFTFDGDEAGQKAALRAFEEDQRFVAQTYVAVEPSGADPCDLRLSHGEGAVRELISSRRPLFEFAIKATLKKFDLDTVEGRVSALRAAAPVVADIRDPAMRPGYSRELAGWLGMDVEDVARAVAGAVKRGHAGAAGKTGREQDQPGRRQDSNRSGQQSPGRDRQGNNRPSGREGGWSAAAPSRQQPNGRAGAPYGQAAHHSYDAGGNDDGAPAYGPEAGQVPAPAPAYPRPDLRDPVVRLEHQALEVVIQQPGLLDANQWEQFMQARFLAPMHVAVHGAVRAAGVSGATPSQWVETIRQEVPEELRNFVSELAVMPLPAQNDDGLRLYCRGILNRLQDLQITHLKADKLGQLQRMDPSADPEDFQRINRELMELEMQRRALRSE